MSTSLIPIKGISQAQKRNLANICKIVDVAGLIAGGRTPAQRQQIASKLRLDRRHVDMWVKQADLWRVEGMTEDYAYLLVLAGVRCVQDLAKIDVETTKGVLKSISNTHPDFVYNENTLSLLKDNAIKLNPSVQASHNLELILQALGDDKAASDLEKFFEIFQNKLSETAIVFDDSDPEPRHLFGMDYVLEILGKKSESEIIDEGLSSLIDVDVYLPLPTALSGKVSYRSKGEIKGRASVNVANLLVEVSGLVIKGGTQADSNRIAANGYTDGEGKFVIDLPDGYVFEDRVTFTFSQGSCKQSFNLSSSEIISGCTVKNSIVKVSNEELVDNLEKIDDACNIISLYEFNLRIVNVISDLESVEHKGSVPGSEDARELLIKKLKGRIKLAQIEDEDTAKIRENITRTTTADIRTYLEKEIKICNASRKDAVVAIFGMDITRTDEEKTVSNLIKKIEMEWKYGLGDKEDGFVIIEEVFKGYMDDYQSALPSVKLMGEGDDAVWLPTDRAPSRSFSYSLLNRLVEPNLSIPEDSPSFDDTVKSRKRISDPLDVARFREDFGVNPGSQRIMASLGMGYTLNMSQSWVPDGFALGQLLYSTILAPGEEQRLIVREKSISYDITDVAKGEDYTHGTQDQRQNDAITGIYNYALKQLSEGMTEESYSTETWTGGGSGGGGLGGLFSGIVGLFAGSASGSKSKSKGQSSSYSRQSNSQQEASRAAQLFNQQFSVAASLYEQANRISIRHARSDESDSVATRIIANHNHSHAMTMQYWEVVRRYRLQTCIEGVDLVLFVPLKPVRFLPELQKETLDLTEAFKINSDRPVVDEPGVRKKAFDDRYSVVLQNYTALRRALPGKYRKGIDLIQKYHALPYFKVDDFYEGNFTYRICVTGSFLPFDNLTARITFNDGAQAVVGHKTLAHYDTLSLEEEKINETTSFKTFPTCRADVKKAVYRGREAHTKDEVWFEFEFPYGTDKNNIKRLEIRNEIPDGWDYELSCREPDLTEAEKNAIKLYEMNMNELFEDNKNSASDLRDIIHAKKGLPESYLHPIVSFTAKELRSYGDLWVSICEMDDKCRKTTNLEGKVLLGAGALYHKYENTVPLLTINQLQVMEETFQHIITNTLKYSKAVWQSLSTDEYAMMLEQYTVDMDFEKEFDLNDKDEQEDERGEKTGEKEKETDIPLLNCINVKNPLGFYGNCIIFPFTYPEKIARKLGKTAADLQDALFRYHAYNFRSPSTVVSIPTDGMIGEAVLGATNVSEKIDLTRFWNWKDSPIDSMTLNNTYLDSKDYLENKTTPQITPLGLDQMQLTKPIEVADLIKALIEKKTPEFDNITGLEQAAAILNKATDTTAAGRDKVIDETSKMSQESMKSISDIMKIKIQSDKEERLKDKDIEIEKIRAENGYYEHMGKNGTDKPTADKPAADKPTGTQPGGGTGGKPGTQGLSKNKTEAIAELLESYCKDCDKLAQAKGKS